MVLPWQEEWGLWFMSEVEQPVLPKAARPFAWRSSTHCGAVWILGQMLRREPVQPEPLPWRVLVMGWGAGVLHSCTATP